jgi:Rrf2 family protein
MKITAIEEYGLRCLLLLAKSGLDHPLTLPELKTLEGLSIPYSAKLMMILKQAGLVKAVRGRNGGYVLARRPEIITLQEALDALGEPTFSPAHCKKHTGLFDICVHDSDCRMREIWKSFQDFMGNLLGKITLADVVYGKLDILNRVNISMGIDGDSTSNRAVQSGI